MDHELTREDRPRITDTTHNIQAASESLSGVDSRKVPGFATVVKCLQDADKTLRGVLRSLRPQLKRTE